MLIRGIVLFKRVVSWDGCRPYCFCLGSFVLFLIRGFSSKYTIIISNYLYKNMNTDIIAKLGTNQIHVSFLYLMITKSRKILFLNAGNFRLLTFFFILVQEESCTRSQFRLWKHSTRSNLERKNILQRIPVQVV